MGRKWENTGSTAIMSLIISLNQLNFGRPFEKTWTCWWLERPRWSRFYLEPQRSEVRIPNLSNKFRSSFIELDYLVESSKESYASRTVRLNDVWIQSFWLKTFWSLGQWTVFIEHTENCSPICFEQPFGATGMRWQILFANFAIPKRLTTLQTGSLVKTPCLLAGETSHTKRSLSKRSSQTAQNLSISIIYIQMQRIWVAQSLSSNHRRTMPSSPFASLECLRIEVSSLARKF